MCSVYTSKLNVYSLSSFQREVNIQLIKDDDCNWINAYADTITLANNFKRSGNIFEYYSTIVNLKYIGVQR